MELAELISGLADPSAYPFSVSGVEVRQTHISAVFLTDQYVYKVKKPVDYGFLDFGTLKQRRHFCHEELRLNRRLAAEVYLQVVPITAIDGHVRVESAGEPLEWAVKMRRLPDNATLAERLAHGDVDAHSMRELGLRIANFHAAADSGPHIDAFGHFDVVADNARQNFAQSLEQIGQTVSRAVFHRLQSLTEAELQRLRPLIESRAKRGVPRDTHGDLRLDHVYLLPDRQPPDNLVVIDCVEFSQRFRFADPISDIAFLIMDLNLHGQRELAREFLAAYIQASGDDQGRKLVPLYTAYRAAVRGKVEGLKLNRGEMDQAEQQAAFAQARRSWLLALDQLQQPQLRPCLLLVAGLPGTGKSTLAQQLCASANLHWIRSDVVRQELASAARDQPQPTSSSPTTMQTSPATPSSCGEGVYGQGLYTAEWNRRTYRECLRRATELLFEGERVLVDANFRIEADRREFLDAAAMMGVRCAAIACQADAQVVRTRLANRHGDASQADWSVYERAAQTWQQPGPRTRSVWRIIDSGGSLHNSVAQALEALRHWGLLADNSHSC